MKIRKGFVSNSSSTSFCIYGVSLDELSEENAEKLEKAGMEVHYGPEGDGAYVGLSWSSVKDKETGASFKLKIRQKIKGILGDDLTFETYEEAWHD